MELTIAWVLFPLVLLALCVGCGLARRAARRDSAPGRPACPRSGSPSIVVVGQFPPCGTRRPSSRSPIVVALAIAGFRAVMGAVAAPRAVGGRRSRSSSSRPTPRRSCSPGRPTFAGYIRLDDTATWMALTDRVMEHGRSLAGLAPSTYEATLSFNLGDGYPIGVFLPLGVARALVGPDVAWLIQPYMAFGGGAARPGAVAARASRSSARCRCARRCRFLAALSALLFGYYLWGGHQGGRRGGAPGELRGAGGIRDPPAVRAPVARSRSAIVGGALIGVLSGGGAIWLLPVLLPLAAFARSRARGARHGADRRRLRDRGRGPLRAGARVRRACCRRPPRRSAAPPPWATSSHPLERAAALRDLAARGTSAWIPRSSMTAYALIARRGGARARRPLRGMADAGVVDARLRGRRRSSPAA